MKRCELKRLLCDFRCAREAAYSKEGLWPPRWHRVLVKRIEDVEARLTDEYPPVVDALDRA